MPETMKPSGKVDAGDMDAVDEVIEKLKGDSRSMAL